MVDPTGTIAVSFHAMLSFGTSSRARTTKRWPCTWTGWFMGWNESGELKTRILTRSPCWKVQWMSPFSRPVSMSRRIQVTCVPDESQFIIGMASFHSMGGM